jgi:hypothetical protein
MDLLLLPRPNIRIWISSIQSLSIREQCTDHRQEGEEEDHFCIHHNRLSFYLAEGVAVHL